MKNQLNIIREACATKETGAYYPQISKMSKDYNFKSEDSVYNLIKVYHNNIPPFAPNFDYFILNGKSKLSDFLSCIFLSKNGFLVSEKVKSIFEKFNLPNHKFYSVKILYKKEFIENYYWLHIICDLTDMIDYPQSSFQLLNISNKPIKELFFDSKESFVESKEKFKLEAKQNNTNWSIGIKTVFFKPIQYDLFSIGGTLDTDFYVTENLKNELLNNSITGLEFDSTNKISL